MWIADVSDHLHDYIYSMCMYGLTDATNFQNFFWLAYTYISVNLDLCDNSNFTKY